MKAGQVAPRALNILLAEDDPGDIDKVNEAVARDGIPAQFFLVNDGQEVLDYLRGEGEFGEREKFPFPDLIVLNVHMPQMSGLDVLKWLKEHPNCSHVPTVMLSASADEDHIEEAYRLGVNSYLRKPSTVEAMTKVLRTLAGYWQMTERPEFAKTCR
jgi:CheY-like chemotaxis protein